MKLGLKKHWPKTHPGVNFGEGQRSCRVNIGHLNWLMQNCECDQYCEKYSRSHLALHIRKSDTACLEVCMK